MILEANPGLGTPTGIHGEIRVPIGSTNEQIVAAIKDRLSKERVFGYSNNFNIKKFGADDLGEIVAFEVL